MNQFIQGMWFVLYERKMPQKPVHTWLLQPWGRCALTPQPGLFVVLHQLHFPVLTIMILEEIIQKILLCLKTTMDTSQTGAQGLCFYRNLHPKCAKLADKPKKAEEDSGGRGQGLYQGPCGHPCDLLAVPLSW